MEADLLGGLGVGITLRFFKFEIRNPKFELPFSPARGILESDAVCPRP